MRQVPTDPKQNILFRADLHEYLAGSTKQARNDFVEMCRVKPQITFKTMFWTFQPKPNIEPKGVFPFITWDWQDDSIEEINYLMLNGGKLQAKKSREVGGTWIILGSGLNLWLWTPKNMGLVISRKEEMVDKKGNPDTLFWKLDFMIARLPEWATPSYDRTDRHLKNMWNESVIDGEATVENVGRCGRRNWVFCDEFPAVKHADAECIDRALTDTAACRIFLGTSEYRSHPFSKMGLTKGVKKMVLGWWLHPFKARGLYWSPDINKIVIEDIDYYRKIAPKVFDKCEKGKEIKYSELETELLYAYPELKIPFTADGGQPNKPKWRSPWYDTTCLERTVLDIATNLDMNEIGAGDMVFDSAILDQMISQYVRKPDYVGEIVYSVCDNTVDSIRFIQGGKGRLKWWGELGGSRPLQNHNFVLGCDISLGQGQSNSVCSIFDIDERMKVGSWVDSYTMPESFAEQAFAVGKWVGGMSGVPLLNFDATGIGQVFSKRIKELGYSLVYKMATERKGFHERGFTIGYNFNSNTKLALFTSYSAALTDCFRSALLTNKKFINPDEEAIRECEDYIFNGSQIVMSRCIEDSSGAQAAHGDRCVADALCSIAAQEQPRAVHRFMENIEGSIEWRKKRQRESEREKRDKVKVWLDF
ncbi:MAG: hypothetical protein MUP81_03140 [Dehalococcoidia bacterium]|nr:hypothetical protein [Dehalococcoidia bacterium]